MFTVKWQNPAIGYEQLFTADSVWERNDNDGHVVYADLGKDRIHPFHNGTVYVMNDNGKTVAAYHLPNSLPNPAEIRLAPPTDGTPFRFGTTDVPSTANTTRYGTNVVGIHNN